MRQKSFLPYAKAFKIFNTFSSSFFSDKFSFHLIFIYFCDSKQDSERIIVLGEKNFHEFSYKEDDEKCRECQKEIFDTHVYISNQSLNRMEEEDFFDFWL